MYRIEIEALGSVGDVNNSKSLQWWRGKQLWQSLLCSEKFNFAIWHPAAGTHTHAYTRRILNATAPESTGPAAIDMPPLFDGFLTANVTAPATATANCLRLPTADCRLLEIGNWILDPQSVLNPGQLQRCSFLSNKRCHRSGALRWSSSLWR